MNNNPGTKIKYLRTISNMSQEELGRRIGVQRAAIQKYEKGVVENIPLKTIEKIAQVFDVSPTYIVGWSLEEGNQLSVEVKVLQAIKNIYGSDCVELLEDFVFLTPEGRNRVKQYISDMRLIYDSER